MTIKDPFSSRRGIEAGFIDATLTLLATNANFAWRETTTRRQYVTATYADLFMSQNTYNSRFSSFMLLKLYWRSMRIYQIDFKLVNNSYYALQSSSQSLLSHS